jgi:LPXTG-motif cell wall-anchored protein
MFKKLVLIAVVLTALLATASPALAQGTYYVNTAYTGTELGTMAQPFNTIEEAIAAAQANPYGGYIYNWTGNTWRYYGYIQTVNPPYSGASLSHTALFVLLGLASLILVAAGWFLRRRARALPSGT